MHVRFFLCGSRRVKSQLSHLRQNLSPPYVSVDLLNRLGKV
jgi:hypothetical protein